jgi:hypothetical protein
MTTRRALKIRPFAFLSSDDRARLLGEVEIVLVEGVLRAVPAAGHALAALGAGVAGGARAAEVGVGGLVAWGRLRLAVGVPSVAEEDADRGEVEGVADTQLLRRRLQVDVGRGHRRVEPYAEHALRLVVVRLQLVLPVRDVTPLGVVEEGLRRDVQSVGVVERAAADACAGQHHDVAEEVDALDAVAAELRGPEVVLDVPGVLGKGGAGETAAGFQDAYAVALLRQAQGGYGTAEA